MVLKKYDDRFAEKKKQKEITNEIEIPPSTLRIVLKNRYVIEQSRLAEGSKLQKVKH